MPRLMSGRDSSSLVAAAEVLPVDDHQALQQEYGTYDEYRNESPEEENAQGAVGSGIEKHQQQLVKKQLQILETIIDQNLDLITVAQKISSSSRVEATCGLVRPSNPGGRICPLLIGALLPRSASPTTGSSCRPTKQQRTLLLESKI